MPSLRKLDLSGSAPDNGSLTRVSFAGENSNSADLGSLGEAQKRYNSPEFQGGTDSTAKIWRDTGWFKGLDGEWRYEISDKGASFKNGIFSHPELEKAYPKLFSEWTIREEDLNSSTSYGYTNPETKEIVVNSEISEEAKTLTAIHEFQHAVQELEDFGRGGALLSRETLMIDDAKGSHESKRARAKLMDVLKEFGFKTYLDYLLREEVDPEKDLELDFQIASRLGVPKIEYKPWTGGGMLRELSDKARSGKETSLESVYSTYQNYPGEAMSRLTEKRYKGSEDYFPLLGLDVPPVSIITQERLR